MKVIIAGSRSITDFEVVFQAVAESGFEITEVVSGGADGVDKLGEFWARHHHVGVRVFPAQWAKFGKSAGYKRNTQMAENAEALVAVWDGESRGTAHMISEAKAKGLLIYVKHVEKPFHAKPSAAVEHAANQVADMEIKREEKPPADDSQDRPSYKRKRAK